jgi:molybdenum cofactor biosynthesis enzyme MoaA
MKQCRIAITEKCNLNCEYCCMKQPDILNTFKVVHNIYQIDDLHKYDTIMITGGEPLEDFRILRNTMSRIVDLVPRNTKIYLYTNGLKLQEEDFEWTLKKWFNGINIGLHDPDSWDYQEILSEVNKIIPVRILINEDLIPDNFVEWCKKNNVDYRAWKMNDCHVKEDRYLIKRG